MGNIEINTADDFKNTIGELVDSIAKSNVKDYDAISGKIADSLENAPYDLMNPDIYNSIIGNRVRMLMGKTIEKLYDGKDSIIIEDRMGVFEKKLNIKDMDKIQFLYLEYQYLQHNIEKLIEEKLESSICIDDRNRFVLGVYMEYLLTGIIKKTDLSEHFWLPKFGTNENWVGFCEGLYEMYYGNPDRYILARTKLLEAEIRKYEHTIYKVYAFFKDGKKVLISNYTDIEPELPEPEDSYYMMDKDAFDCEQQYEDYGEGLGGLFYKVPQEDINSFEILTETKMM